MEAVGKNMACGFLELVKIFNPADLEEKIIIKAYRQSSLETGIFSYICIIPLVLYIELRIIVKIPPNGEERYFIK